LTTNTRKARLLPTEAEFSPLRTSFWTKTSAVACAVLLTVKVADWRTAPFERRRFTFQDPTELGVDGSVKKYWCASSGDASVDCTIRPEVFSQATFHGNTLTGTPEAFAQTTSPKLKEVFGVVQSAAKVAIPSGDKKGVNNDVRLRAVGMDNDRARAVPLTPATDDFHLSPAFAVREAWCLRKEVAEDGK
jgi:hypothetical protein